MFYNLPLRRYSLHYHSVDRLVCDHLKWFVRRHRPQLHSQRGPGYCFHLPHDAKGHGFWQIRAELKVHRGREISIVVQRVPNHNLVAFSCERKKAAEEEL